MGYMVNKRVRSNDLRQGKLRGLCHVTFSSTHFSIIWECQHSCHDREREWGRLLCNTVCSVQGLQSTCPLHREVAMHDTGIQKGSVSGARISTDREHGDIKNYICTQHKRLINNGTKITNLTILKNLTKLLES